MEQEPLIREEEPFIKLDWEEIESEFCVKGDCGFNEYIRRDHTYYIEKQVFLEDFTNYIDALIVGAGGISGVRREYYYNYGGWGDRLFSQGSHCGLDVYYLHEANKDKFEIAINKMLSSELLALDIVDSYDKGRGCWCF